MSQTETVSRKLEHRRGRCCRRAVDLRPVKMSAPSLVATGLKLDNGINYVKCAVRNNAPIAPIYRASNDNNGFSDPSELLQHPNGRRNNRNSISGNSASCISISSPCGDDLAQRQDNSNHRIPQSRPRGRRRGRRRSQCAWMWRRWISSFPSLVSSLLVSVSSKALSPATIRLQQQQQLKKCMSHEISVASECFTSEKIHEKEEEIVNEDDGLCKLNGDSDCENYQQLIACDDDGRKMLSSSRNRPRSRRRSTPSSSQSLLGGVIRFDAKLVLLIMVLIGVIDYSEAGTCWLRRMESTGKCNKLFARNVTRDDCCHAGTGLGFTARDITDVQLFFVNAFNDGMDCSSCLDSCERAKCGANKRCVMKKGRPKCICAPNCKAAKQAKQFPRQNIKVINLSESQRTSRQYFSTGPRAVASRSAPSIQYGGSSNKRSVRLLGGEPSTHHSRTVKNSVSEKTLSQRSSNSKLANSKRKDNLLESVTLVSSKSSTDSSSTNCSTTASSGCIRPSDRMVLMADSPSPDNSYPRKSRSEAVPMLVTSSSSNVRHRNRKASAGHNKTLAAHRVHEESSRTLHHSRDFGKPRLLRTAPGAKNATNSGSSRLPRQPQYLEEMFYVPQSRRSRLRGTEFDFGNEIMQHTGFYNPVCGTDGKTYKTECQLKKRACRQESTTLIVAYKGHCQTSCRLVQCSDGKHCVEDQNSTPHCVTCVKDCPADPRTSFSTKSVVCGTDGITYRSICELKQKACLTGRAIPVAYRGRCIEAATCDTIKCKDRQHCLTDLKTHKPRCVSCSYKCPRIKRQQQGRIRQFGGAAGGGGGGGGGHQRNQHQPNVKLCGTNNHTYHSWCHMLRDSCNTGFYIDVQYNGVCSFERSFASPTLLSRSTVNVKP